MRDRSVEACLCLIYLIGTGEQKDRDLSFQ